MRDRQISIQHLRPALLTILTAAAILSATPHVSAGESSVPWLDVVQRLEPIVDNPHDREAAQLLVFVADALPDDPTTADIKAGSLSIVTLAQLLSGRDLREGIRACKALASRYPTTASWMRPEGLVRKQNVQGQMILVPIVKEIERRIRDAGVKTLALAQQRLAEGKLQAVRVAVKASGFSLTPEPPEMPQTFIPSHFGEEPLAAWRPGRIPDQNLYDTLVTLSLDSDMPVAVDPEMMGIISGARVPAHAVPATFDMTTLEQLLKPHGLRVYNVELSDALSVALVSTRAARQYLAVSEVFSKGYSKPTVERLHASLPEPDRLDSGPSALHLGQLKSLLEDMSEILAEIDEVVRSGHAAGRAFETAEGAIAMASHSRGLTKSRGHEANATDNVYNTMVKNVERAHKQFSVFIDQLVALSGNTDRSYSAVIHDFNQVFVEYPAEALFLLEYIKGNSETMVDLMSSLRPMLIRMGEAWTDHYTPIKGSAPRWLDTLSTLTTKHQELPHDLEDWIRGLKGDQTKAVQECNTAIRYINTNNDRAFAAFSTALATDSANLQARAGLAYCTMRQAHDSLRNTLRRDSISLTQASELATMLQRRRKMSLYRALQAVALRETSGLTESDRSKNATAVGLAVSANMGQLFPVSIRVDAIAKSQPPPKATTSASYWDGIVYRKIHIDVAEVSSGLPISFGDYGDKDPLMVVSALEACKWLLWKYPDALGKRGRGNGLIVGFHDLYSSKGGDSAGSAMAVAGYSALMSKPVLQGVAISGSVRADGSIHAVGGIAEKIHGAAMADDIELVIVPRKNETDLRAVPVGHLCLTTIVLADEMDQVVRFATDAAHKRAALEELRQAQALILLGCPRSAQPILGRVSERHPELYSARRLLELTQVHAAEQEGITHD